jgi:hypothetical protein
VGVPRRARCRRRGSRRGGQGLPHPDWHAWKVIEFDPFCGFFGREGEEFGLMLVKIVALGSILLFSCIWGRQRVVSA